MFIIFISSDLDSYNNYFGKLYNINMPRMALHYVMTYEIDNCDDEINLNLIFC